MVFTASSSDWYLNRSSVIVGPANVLNNTNSISSGAGSLEPKNPSDLWEDNPYVPKDEQIVPTALLFALCVVIPLGKQQFCLVSVGSWRFVRRLEWFRVSLRLIGNEMMLRTVTWNLSIEWNSETFLDFHRMFNISGIELSKGMTRRQLDGTFLAWHFLSETMVLFPISIFLHQFSAENHPKGGSFLSVCQASWLWCPGSKWSQETLLRLCTLVCSQTWL